MGTPPFSADFLRVRRRGSCSSAKENADRTGPRAVVRASLKANKTPTLLFVIIITTAT